MIERVDGDVTKLGTFLSEFLVQIVLNGVLLIGVLVMLFAVDWRVGVPVLIGLVIAIASAGALTRPLAKLSEKERQSSAELYGFLEERLAGTEDIRANGGVGYVLRRHIERARDLFRKTLKAFVVGMLSWRSLNTAINIGGVCALIIGALLHLQGVITLG
jgi:ABC-type multidrug transport system fused ATPase/permease subunit